MKKLNNLFNPRAQTTPTTSNSSWYQMKNQGGNVELMIYDEIGGWGISAQQFARELAGLGRVTTINARIHSPGGDVFEGMAIYNLLKGHPAHKICHIDGLAASMASVIAMAFDEVIMPANAMIMIHKPWGGTIGDADEMRKYADLLDKVESTLISAYIQKTGLAEDELQAMLAEETWLTGAEAVAKGFADTLAQPLQMAAQLNSKRMKDFTNMPEALKKLFEPQGNAPAAPATPAATIVAALPSAADIQAAAAQYNKTRIDGINAVFAAFPQFSAEQTACISDAACTADQAKDKLLAKLGEQASPSAPNASSRNHGHITNGNLVGDSVRAALMHRAGHSEREKDNAYGSFSLRELARASLSDRGIIITGDGIMAMVGMAFTHSSSDFGSILLDVANKSVLMGWEQAEETFDLWTKKGQLSDFKVAHRVGLGEFNSLREVRPGAEYKYVTVGDRAEKIALATFGELFSINRQAIINDDLSVLTDIPMKLGAAARGTIGDLVYAVLTKNGAMSDNKAIFHADHGNVLGGAATVDNLGAAKTLMRRQKSGSRTLNIRPEFVLCSTAKEDSIRQTIMSSSVRGADANAGIENPIRNFAEVIGEPRLDDHNVDQWYLAAGQGKDTIEVAYLDGIDMPYIEQQSGFSVDGVATKVRIDAGVAPLDWRGLVRSTGV